MRLFLADWRHEHEEMMRGRIGQHLQVVRTVLVVRGHVDRHHALEKRLGGAVEGEERVAVHVEPQAGMKYTN